MGKWEIPELREGLRKGGKDPGIPKYRGSLGFLQDFQLELAHSAPRPFQLLLHGRSRIPAQQLLEALGKEIPDGPDPENPKKVPKIPGQGFREEFKRGFPGIWGRWELLMEEGEPILENSRVSGMGQVGF